ncbi:tiggy-winkle hedgehog protein-like [Montipora capricornis]|uniref:tiggy-winkle hedgehog protein-like n=1 Tax=Montipora capricornis TaxID=246305 RepID=UPI0035F0FB92
MTHSGVVPLFQGYFSRKELQSSENSRRKHEGIGKQKKSNDFGFFHVLWILIVTIATSEATQEQNNFWSTKIVTEIQPASLVSSQNTTTLTPEVMNATPLPWPHPLLTGSPSMTTYNPANQSNGGLNTSNITLGTLKPIGCYRDSYVKPRPLPELIADFRDDIDFNDANKTIKACAEKAREKGFKFFGVQFYTECWSGAGAEKTYARDGASKDCTHGVGNSGSNFVYTFNDNETLPCPTCEHPRHLCFPGISRVTLESGDSITLEQLRVGDRVRTLGTNGETTYGEVITFLHRETEKQAEFCKLEISGGNTILLSPQHLIFRKRNSSSVISAIFASEIEPGDLVSNGSSSFYEAVTRVTMVMEKGVYAPLTSQGTMLVDGVLVSCYASWPSHDTAHLVMAPLRAWKWLANYFVLPTMLMENGPEADEISWYALILMTLTGMFN